MSSKKRSAEQYDATALKYGGVPVPAPLGVAIERVHFDEGTLLVTFVGGDEAVFEDVPFVCFQSLVARVTDDEQRARAALEHQEELHHG